MRIVQDTALWGFIEQALVQGRQSPAAIAGRLATGLDGLPYVSRATIERFIHSVYGRRIEYELLNLKQAKLHGYRRASQAEPLDNRTFIDDRPSVITNRERVGDLEADFIVSGKGGTGYLLTAVDRKIRYGFIRKVLPVTVGNAERAFADIHQEFPELTSITLDNDLLFRYHERLQTDLGVPLYFCHPYHSWEKGTVENFNRQVRKYVKKGSDVSQYSEDYLSFVAARLNARFMSVIGYQTPRECLDEYRNNKKPAA